MISKPQPTDYPDYFENYINLVKPNNVLKTLQDQVLSMQAFLSAIPEDKEDFSYADGKWTLKEVVGHIIDTERIMGYRALRFARGDYRELAGFDEKSYIQNSNFNNRTLYDLAHEFAVVRESNIILIRNLPEECLDNKGTANGKEISVRSLIYVIAGHAMHHLNVIKTRYLLVAEEA